MATPTSLPATFVSGAVLTAAQMNNLRGAFRVLQVVQTSKTDTFSATSTSYTDVTGMSASITPSATSSKVLVVVNTAATISVNGLYTMQLVRGLTPIYVGDAAGSRIQASTASQAPTDYMIPGTIVFLDSPNTTSATTYKIQIRSNTGTVYINRTGTDTDNSTYFRSASSITVMEISA